MDIVLEILRHTGCALVLILSIAILRIILTRVLGREERVLGVRVSVFFDVAHFAILFAWTARCVLDAARYIAGT